MLTTLALWLFDPTAPVVLALWGVDAAVAYIVCCEAFARTATEELPPFRPPFGPAEVICLVCPPVGIFLGPWLALGVALHRAGWLPLPGDPVEPTDDDLFDDDDDR